MKTIFLLFLVVPLVAFAQISHSVPGRPVSVGDGLWISAPDYDPDAAAYFVRATVQDAVARRRISDFVKGLKALGVWGNVTEAWLLRSVQNAGDGGTAYGLKGAYNGTFANAPTWGAEGVTLSTNAGQSITTSIPAVFPRTLLLVLDDHIAAGSVGVSSTMGPVSTGQSGAMVVNAADNWSLRGNVGGTGFNLAFPSTSGPRFYAGYVADGLQRVHTNGTLSASSSLSGTPTAGNFTIIAGLPGTLTDVTGTITVPFAMLIEGPSVDAAAIYALYKTTIGTGLGLP